jgi:predicted membrane channel-forming protein YqfA (hemolysin III family)
MFIFAVCGTWLIALGLYFMFLRTALLPEDVRYIGTSLREIQAVAPGLERWLHRVFTVMGGFIAGAGVLTIFVAVNARAARKRWTCAVLAFAGLFTVGTMTATNFQLNSDFKLLLLAPSVLWLVGLVYYIVRNDRHA